MNISQLLTNLTENTIIGWKFHAYHTRFDMYIYVYFFIRTAYGKFAYHEAVSWLPLGTHLKILVSILI